VDVFEDEDRRAVELCEDGAGGVPGVRSGECVRERPTGPVGDVGERAERARRREILARPCEDPSLRPRAEGTDERRLPDARLAAQEHESAALAPGVLQEREQLLPLEQLRQARLHGATTRTEHAHAGGPTNRARASRLAP